MKLKIGFNARALVNPNIRGWSRYTIELLKALSKIEDIELVLFSLEEPFSEHLKDIKAKVVTFNASRESIWNDWILPRMVRKEGISVFHAPADRGLPIWKHCPMVVTIHNSFERTYWKKIFKTPKSRIWYWKNEIVNYFISDAIITVSNTTMNELKQHKFAPGKKIYTIYLAPSSDFNHFSSQEDESILKKYRVGIPYILYVGGYDEHKNTDSLVKAFNKASINSHYLVIISEKKGNYFTLLEQWHKLPCFNRLYLLEVLPKEIASFYRKADFFVNPSFWESFSFQLVEAMACGTPILASKRKAIPEILGNAGILFDPEDVNGLARNMGKMANNESLKKDLREKGFERIKNFSWEKTARETINVYLKLLGRNSL